MPGSGVQFNTIRTSGVITNISPAAGTMTIREESGMERTFPLESVAIRMDGRRIPLEMLRQGQKVTVEGSQIAF